MRPVLALAFVGVYLALASPARSQFPSIGAGGAVLPPSPCGSGCGGTSDLSPRPGDLRPDEAPIGGPAFAVVGEHLISGVYRPLTSRPSGLLQLADATGFGCIGAYGPSESGAQVLLRCSDGLQVRMATRRLGDDGAYAESVGDTVSVSLSYGVSAHLAAGRLHAPAGYVLIAERGRLRLERAKR